MKKLYLLPFAIFIPMIFSAQPYFNYGATWYYDYWPLDTTSYVKIEKTAEVMQGGKLCDELTFSYYNFSQSPIPSIIQWYTYGTGDSVFIFKTQNSTFGILYDFSHQTGDTISCAVCSGSFIIDSISQVTIGNSVLETQHTRMYSSSSTYITYEKIGNTGFLIPHMQMTNPSEPGNNLRCYQDHTGLYLHTGISESCDDGNELHDTTSLQVMTGQFAISVISDAIVPGTEINIYDCQGRLVAREYATQSTTCYIEMQLDARAAYFVTVRNGEEYLSEKFVLVNPY